MMPIWLTCWAINVVMVLTTKKADNSRITQLKVDRIRMVVLTIDR